MLNVNTRLTLAGDVASFNQTALKTSMLAAFGNVLDVRLTIVPASVHPGAAASAAALASSPPDITSAAFAIVNGYGVFLTFITASACCRPFLSCTSRCRSEHGAAWNETRRLIVTLVSTRWALRRWA